MTPERWQQVKTVLQDTLAQPEAERAAFLARTSREDADLAREVESLLAAHDEAGAFIVAPALAHIDAASVIERLQDTLTWSGRRAGPYLLVREIGHGGMGAVYLGIRDDDEYRKQVAIKVVRSSFDRAFIAQRFRHERQILADLDHPNVARLIDGGSAEDGSPYFVMEYVDGLPIDRYCDVNGLSIDARLRLFLDVCAAVHYAHQHLVVHRDLKASNILVTADGAPKLLDFGIAKLLASDAQVPEDRTLTVMRVMTLESASPEQVRGETVTTATDVYALGVMLHRLLTGRGPYEATPTSHDLARAICEEDPQRPSDAAADAHAARRLRGDLDTIVLKALQKEPARRYGTVEQFADDITRHLDGLPVLARPDTIRYRTAKFVTRHKTGVAVAALVAVSLVAGVVATAWQTHVARVQRGRAERRFNDVRRLANSFLFEFHDAIKDLPGSTKARELVVRRATEYLDSLASESTHDASLDRELAAAYDKVGDVEGLPSFANLGDTAGALQSHKKALALREALAAANPSDTAIQRDLRTTYDHISSIMTRTGDVPGAVAYQRKGLGIAEALYARNPTGVQERRSLGVAYHSAADITVLLDDMKGTLEYSQREANMFESLLASDPTNPRAQRDVSVAYKKLGAVLEKMGDPAAAVVHYRKSIALDEPRARAQPGNGEAMLDLSFGYASIGYTLSKANNIPESLENYQRALSLREQAAATDPNDVNAKDAVARAYVSIGQVLRGDRRPLEAIPHFRHALEILSARHIADPGNSTIGDNLAMVYASLADTSAKAAAASRRPIDRARLWREAREWSRTSIGAWTESRARHALSPEHQSELDSLVALVATCDRELSRLADGSTK
jgi:tetratricopeptide (TPR) repeat protein/tRNA A-37 threonylcarbamoyl transferase component Bud32